MYSQSQKAEQFKALHQGPGAFVIPNPWDVGTARLLAQAGFKALATTSAGFAFSRGRPDNGIERDEMLAHVRELAQASELPVSADLENGFGHEPETVAETIRLAAAAGLVGGSIEDATGEHDRPIYERAQAVARIAAAVAAARALPFPFTLTARAENFLFGRPDLTDTIERLQAYQAAGADVLYAPGLTRREEIVAVVSALDRPVNILMGSAGVRFSVTELSAWGVRRVSVGSALSRAALGAFLAAAREIQEHGTFTFADAAVPYREMNERFAGSP